MKQHVGGIICPIATPIDEDEHLVVGDLCRLLQRIIPHVDGVFPLGSSGQFALIGEAVADAVVDVTVQQVAGRRPVYVGVSESCTSSVVRNLRRARPEGVDFVVVCTSYYYPFRHPQALVDHFRRVADLSPKPVILYNIPQNTGIPIPVDCVAALSEHPNIAGIKDSAGDMLVFQELLALRSSGFAVMQGREQLAAASLWLGADGIVSALANFAPQLLQQLAQAIPFGDREQIRTLQRQITRLACVFDQTYWLSGLMAALHELGIGNGRAGAPLPACSPEQRTVIRSRMLEAGLLPE